MSRTYRRLDQRYERHWALKQLVWVAGRYKPVWIEPESAEGRRALARYHSDSGIVIHGGVPQWFRRIFKRSQKNANARELRRWLANPDYEPVIEVQHRHSAQWAWW